VVLNLLSSEDLQALGSGVRQAQIRKWVVVRLFKDAMNQGGLLNASDVAAILRISTASVSRTIKEHERQTGEVVPRRATVHDMGPTITHKATICRKVIVEGRSIDEAARETLHSPEAVSRYVQDYRRVLACLKQGLSVRQSAYATGMSESLVSEYQRLIEQYGDQHES
jgi:predicted transcriptional regulator